jgi:hypothetical protein
LQAYVYTKAAKIVGIEINSDFCNIQNKVVKKYNFQVCERSSRYASKSFSETLIHKLTASLILSLFILEEDIR